MTGSGDGPMVLKVIRYDVDTGVHRDENSYAGGGAVSGAPLVPDPAALRSRQLLPTVIPNPARDRCRWPAMYASRERGRDRFQRAFDIDF
jgi:hypothetical protein